MAWNLRVSYGVYQKMVATTKQREESWRTFRYGYLKYDETGTCLFNPLSSRSTATIALPTGHSFYPSSWLLTGSLVMQQKADGLPFTRNKLSHPCMFVGSRSNKHVRLPNPCSAAPQAAGHKISLAIRARLYSNGSSTCPATQAHLHWALCQGLEGGS